MNEDQTIDLKEVKDKRLYVSIDEIKPGENYKDVTRSAIDRLKNSLAEDDQLIPVMVDVREKTMGRIIGGNHQYFAIKELIDENKWKHGRTIWIDPVRPKDDKHAKVLALKHNAQYDNPSTERLAEWGAELIDSSYSLADIPVVTDYKVINLMDVMDRVSPSDKAPKEKKLKVINCPHCGEEITL